jgi:hypothetical protein
VNKPGRAALQFSKAHKRTELRIFASLKLKRGRILWDMGFLLLFFVPILSAHPINMKILAEIESSNNPKAYNKKTEARGLYQITPLVFKQFREANLGNPFTLSALFEPNMAKFVADWYLDWLSKRCYVVDDILISWNWGYGHWRKWADKGAVYGCLPKETQKFLIKYHEKEG